MLKIITWSHDKLEFGVMLIVVKISVYTAQLVKNLPAVQETQVQFLGQEDPLEKEMTTHSSSLAWDIPSTEEPWQATVHGVVNSQT